MRDASIGKDSAGNLEKNLKTIRKISEIIEDLKEAGITPQQYNLKHPFEERYSYLH